MKKIVILLFVVGIIFSATAQEENEWRPRTHITGYVNLMGEYTDFTNESDAKDGVDPAIGLSEAAFLVSYKPLRNLEFKGTFVYTHYIELMQALLVEAYGTYTFNEGLKVGVGKYLTPLSPVNQYFYAPLNTAATLPMTTSHYVILPQSISGVQLSGEFGSDSKLGYNVTYGGYRIQGVFPGGVLGLIGRESIVPFAWKYSGASENYLGGTARLYTNYNGIIKAGANFFHGTKSRYGYMLLGSNDAVYVPSFRTAIGADLQFSYGGFKLNAEYYRGNNKTTDLDTQTEVVYDSYYAEAIYEAGIFSPYFRYEYNEDTWGAIYSTFPDAILFNLKIPVSAYTVGIAVRPMYEVLLKFEYRYLTPELQYNDLNDPALSTIGLPTNNPLGLDTAPYNHVLVSAVLSF